MHKATNVILLLACAALTGQGGWAQGIVVDHASLAQFDQIPEVYLQAARNRRVLFMDRSVGINTHNALDCFAATEYGRTPVPCRRDYQFVNGTWQLVLRTGNDLAAGRVPPYIRFHPSATRYDRSNWDFYIFADSWDKMAADFIEGLHNGAIPAQDAVTNAAVTVNPMDFAVVSFQFSYLNVDEGSAITEFFTHRPGEFDDVYDLEREVGEHLTTTNRLFVYWTTSLARSIGTDAATQFNEQMRQWCRSNNKILLDFADIEAHDMNGSPCFDNRDGVPYVTPNGSNSENYPDDGREIPAICQEKTTETDGGHLGTAQGMVSVAKGFWILMARLAGWPQETGASPVISSVVPSSGPTTGNTSIRVLGQNFARDVVVRFGGVAINQLVFVGETELQGTTGPHSAGAVDVEATQAGGMGSLPAGYTYVEVPIVNPIISAVLPNSGPTVGNSLVRILGQHFAPGIVVQFGGVALNQVTYVSETELQGITGPHSAGTVDVEATQPGGTSALAGGYSYRSLPVVSPQAGALRIPFVVDTSEFRTILGVNNLSNQPAQVTISLVDNNGLLVAQRPINVPPLGMSQINNVIQFLEGASAYTGRQGYLVLESAQTIAAWASQVDNVLNDPSMQVARAGSASRLLLPSSVSSSRFGTSLIVVNASASPGTVNLVCRASGGAVQASLENLPIPAFGYSFFPDLYQAFGLGEGFGPVEIETRDIGVIASSRIFSREHTSGYFDAKEMNQALRHAVIPFAVDNAEFRTNLGITNLSDSTAGVLVSLVDSNGLSVASMNTTVPPKGLTQLNSVIQTLLASSIPTNRQGTLWLDSDQDLVAWASQIDNTTQDPSLVVAKPSSNGNLLIPSVTRTGNFRSTLAVVNQGESAASVEFRFRDSQGKQLASRAVTLQPRGFFSSTDIVADLGVTEAFGPLEIVSFNNQPLTAVSRVTSTSHTGGYFEAIRVP
jgi:hypothetical protein